MLSANGYICMHRRLATVVWKFRRQKIFIYIGNEFHENLLHEKFQTRIITTESYLCNCDTILKYYLH